MSFFDKTIDVLLKLNLRVAPHLYDSHIAVWFMVLQILSKKSVIVTNSSLHKKVPIKSGIIKKKLCVWLKRILLKLL